MFMHVSSPKSFSEQVTFLLDYAGQYLREGRAAYAQRTVIRAYEVLRAVPIGARLGDDFVRARKCYEERVQEVGLELCRISSVRIDEKFMKIESIKCGEEDLNLRRH